MMQALYEAILEDERVLENAFKYEDLARQAEASDDQALIEFFRKMRDENRCRAESRAGLGPAVAREEGSTRVRGNDKMQQNLRNRALEEDARRLKQGAHRYLRQEAKVCRNPEREVAILVEKLKKEEPSD